jgi:hypothetical protein
MITHVVIAGLDPAIHAENACAHTSRRVRWRHFSMGHRVKPGGDEGDVVPYPPRGLDESAGVSEQ